jgi:hypothetical protein
VELNISRCSRVVDISSLGGGNIKYLYTVYCRGLQHRQT